MNHSNKVSFWNRIKDQASGKKVDNIEYEMLDLEAQDQKKYSGLNRD